MARTILAFVGLLYRSYFFLGRPSLFPPMSQFPPSVEPSAKTHPQPFTTVKAGSGQGSSSNAPPLVPPDSSSHRRTSSAGTRGGRALTVGFIGGGMMASSLIKGLIKAEVLPAFCISVSDPDKGQLEKLGEMGVTTQPDNAAVAEHSQVIIIAVKPDVVHIVLRQLKPLINQHHLIISIAAGVTISTLQRHLPEGTRVVRVMPNTPALVGQTAAAFALGEAAVPEDQAITKKIFSAVGLALEVKEKDLNAVTGLSGSGPAYVFLFIEALADGGVRAGLPRATALKLAAQTVKGAAEMVLATGDHPGLLKDQVCSPGGTTIAGVEALERGAFRASAMAAVTAATERAKELSAPPPPTV